MKIICIATYEKINKLINYFSTKKFICASLFLDSQNAIFFIKVRRMEKGNLTGCDFFFEMFAARIYSSTG